jgi:hypothetical protein
MVIIVPVVLFWFCIAAYIALSLDGVLLQQQTAFRFFHDFPFDKMPHTNGLLLGILTMALIFLTLAAIPSHRHYFEGENDE